MCLLSTCPLHTNSVWEREAHKYWLVHDDLPRQHSFETTLRFTGGLSAVNVIGTQLRDPINSGLTRWRMAVLNTKMDAAAELGRNPVSKHQIQPEYGTEQADAGRDCRTHLARSNSQARTWTGQSLWENGTQKFTAQK